MDIFKSAGYLADIPIGGKQLGFILNRDKQTVLRSAEKFGNKIVAQPLTNGPSQIGGLSPRLKFQDPRRRLSTGYDTVQKSGVN